MKSGILPPRALLLSLAAQIPGLVWFWPRVWSLTDFAVGVVLLASGCLLNVAAVLAFRRNGNGVCPFSPVTDLALTGPYRFTRNPMYLGLVLISAGAALAGGVRWNLWPAATLGVWLHFRFVLREEAFLYERLGVKYLMYASQTPRWIGLPGTRIVEPAR